ncbi:MAG: double zinc ribbon domain-containing protein [Synergistaceae bacterium]|jgi:predicted amidophosphoribosyltransferase|nr:double zinc ribbon domain-containing protein [Synergistaceae bacterium]
MGDDRQGRVDARRSGGQGIAELIDSLIHIIWPTACPICGRLGKLACEECMETLVGLNEAFCMACGQPVPCAAHPGGPECRAATEYFGACRDVVHVMKYENGRSLARNMGVIMGRRLPRPRADFLVPVPLHAGSEREYNQAEVIAEGASSVWGIPVRPVLRWDADVERQALRSSGGGRQLPAGAMAVNRAVAARSAVLLIDDVFTTGSTLAAASDALRKVGAEVKGAAVWSRGGR